MICINTISDEIDDIVGIFSDRDNEALNKVYSFYTETSGKIDLFEDVSVIVEQLKINLSVRPFSDYLKYYFYNNSELKKAERALTRCLIRCITHS